MASSEKELEQDLLEAGNRLLTPPSSVDELLCLLDKVERLLSRVEQSPFQSMRNALRPSLKALVASELLRHSDMDVKVAVASCISEITRITAPDAPYDDEQMKEFFHLVVESFEKLYDTSSFSYSKRVSILETVAKVRSCVVMLDLECDALILKMFQYFLKAIRDNHSDNVFSSMEIIMSLVLEESEDISSELLSLLLTSVKNNNQDVLSIARRLGEKVLRNCAAKLNPYLVQFVQSTGISLKDYSEIVASICQDTFDPLKLSSVNHPGEHMAEGSTFSVKTGPDEPPQVAKERTLDPGVIEPTVEKLPRSVMSNGTARTGNGDSLVDPNSLKKAKRSHRTNHSKSPDTVTKAELNSLDSVKEIKCETKSAQAPNKRRGRKHKSAMNLTEASDHARIDNEKEANLKEADWSISKDPPNKVAALLSEHEKEIQAQVSSPLDPHNETVNVTLPSSSQSHLDGTPSKRGRRGAKTKKGTHQESEPGSPQVSRKFLLSDQLESKVPPALTAIPKKESEGTSASEVKPRRRSGKKALPVNTNEEETPLSVDVLKKESEGASDSEAKPVKQSGKKRSNINREELSAQQEGTKKRRGKAVSGTDIIEKSSTKKIVSSPKSTSRLSIKDQNHSEESPQRKSKRKRTIGQETPETPCSVDDSGENLVGSKVKVWWPKDKMFYEGVIASFDPFSKKHKVLYDDGDEEILYLRKQRWELVGGEAEAETEQQADLANPDATSDMPKKKKAKTNSDSSIKKTKTDASSKRNGGSSSSRSKGEATKSEGKSGDHGKIGTRSKSELVKTSSKRKDDSVGKSKDTPKVGTKLKDVPTSPAKSKDERSKSATKSKDDTPKTGTPSKAETPKVGPKSKGERPKSVTKSTDDTPKTGPALKAETPKNLKSGTSAKGKSSSSKVEENDDSAKLRSGKKRQRRVKS